MWKPFLDEVKTLQTFLEQQRRLLNSASYEKVAGDHMRNLVAKVKALGKQCQLKADDVSDFVAAVATGPWNEEEKRELSVAASDALLNAQSPNKRRPLQNCKTFSGYFTQADVNVLKGDNSIPMKLDCPSPQIANERLVSNMSFFYCSFLLLKLIWSGIVLTADLSYIPGIAKRMQAVRFLMPSEQAWKSVMRAVLCAGFQLDDGQKLPILRDLKKLVKKLDDGGEVSDMPDDPRDLSNFAKAYPKAEEPLVTW